ncbi:MAG: SCO family protein [Vicinamibacterales bacterium]
MTRMQQMLGVALIVGVTGVGAGIQLSRREATDASLPHRDGRVQVFWSNGTLKSDITYRDDVYEGESRTYYENGAPYELRHYVNGREEGLQQSWTESGLLYLNYEVHDGRRFGLVNPSPCNTVGDERTTQQGHDSRAFTVTLDHRAAPGAQTPDLLELRGTHEGLPYYDEPTFTPRWTPGAHVVNAFSFDTQTGGTISDRTLRGKPYVASFIYTRCAAVCPLVVRQLARVARAMTAHDARIVSFSVTPDVDTPEALAHFGQERGIDPRVWSLATGRKREIYALARSSFFADDTRVGASDDDETAFLHTEKLVLVDGDGRLRGVYNGTQPHAVDQLIADLRALKQVPSE